MWNVGSLITDWNAASLPKFHKFFGDLVANLQFHRPCEAAGLAVFLFVLSKFNKIRYIYRTALA
jgi:hypothetical protein